MYSNPILVYPVHPFCFKENDDDDKVDIQKVVCDQIVDKVMRGQQDKIVMISNDKMFFENENFKEYLVRHKDNCHKYVD